MRPGSVVLTEEAAQKYFGNQNPIGQKLTLDTKYEVEVIGGVAGIVALLSGDFLVLVLIAIVIASPLAWWAMNAWLHNFAYHITVEWWLLLVAGLVALIVALLTVGLQGLKAALMNPVKSLRSE
jgi:putative ABC transport system permease protein